MRRGCMLMVKDLHKIQVGIVGMVREGGRRLLYVYMDSGLVISLA
jgi:hypothetical protein